MRSTTSVSRSPIFSYCLRPREPASAICMTRVSASSSSCDALRPSGRYADSAISAAVDASWRSTERSRTICA